MVGRDLNDYITEFLIQSGRQVITHVIQKFVSKPEELKLKKS